MLKRKSRSPLRVLMMSSYVPRECGIATYAEDVIHAVEPHGAVCQVLAMERDGKSYAYEDRVIGTVLEDRVESYLQAAEAVNDGGFDVLSLQHEFGIYGGHDADHLLYFLDAVRIPVAVTFHTMVRDPSPAMRQNQHLIAQRANAIVVMNGLAIDILREIYDTEPGKVHVIHHGAPVPHHERGDGIKRDLGLEGRRVISTFGLLNPTKGIEYMVQAMPEIVRRYPDAVYLILGQTHPVLRQTEGERYRDGLTSTARDLGIEEHVRFVNRYLTKEEVVSYLLATDTYVTPYINLEQVTSGTLAYAMGMGCPIVATPYLHARYLLQDGRGLVVPERDPRALADAALRLFDDPALMAHMARRNWNYGQTLLWPLVGAEYLRVFREAAGRPS
ncbi:MAG: glycosyltransferase family 4 protein [Armatimonadota bacterium]